MTSLPTTAVLLLAIIMLCGCATRGTYTVERDLAYVPEGDERQQGDLYLPDAPGPHPVALVIHGGGWTGRSHDDMEAAAKVLAENGFAAFNINYRLAPEHRYPAQLEDTHAALRYLASQAERWRLDRNRFTTVGYSAGGHLALLAAAIPDPNGPNIRAISAGGAPVDLMLYPKSPFITKLIGGQPNAYPELWTEASPIHHITAEHPPVYIYHGQWDQIVELKNAKALQAALDNVGVPNRLDIRYLQGHLIVGLYLQPSIQDSIRFFREAFERDRSIP